MNTLDRLSEQTRRGVCLALSAAIVALGLTAGAAGADAAFADAYVHATTARVYVVQLG